MAPNNKSGGVGAQGLSEIEGLSAIIEQLNGAQEGSKKGADALKSLNKRMAELSKEAKRTKDPVNLLSKAFVKLQEGGIKDTSSAIDLMAKEIEGSVQIMSTASSKTLGETIENIKKMQADLVSKGQGGTREATMLNAKRSKLEMDRFRDERNAMIGRAKMLQQGSEGLVGRGVGVGMGVLNATMKHGADAAEFLGEALGLESAAMMTVAAVAGVVLAAFMTFNFAAKALAKSMTDMAKGGETLNPTLEGAAKYFHEVDSAAKDSLMTFDKMQELMVVMNKEFGRSIGLTADFAGYIANVGQTFGMTNDDAVRLATKMGVLSRTMNQVDIKRSFAELGMQAGELKIPLDALAEPMMTLSELAGATGHSVVEASNGLNLIIQSVKSLGSSGKAMFANMHGGDIAKFTKEFAGFIAGMDEWTLAAMTFKENENFQQTADRVTGMGTKARMGALNQMFTENEVQSPAERGMLMGAKNFSEANRLGSIATAAINTGMNDSQFSAALAKSIDDQLNDRKTTGERIQFGQDPTAFVMDRIQKLLESLLHIESAVTLFSSKSKSGAAMVTSSAAKLPASATAMASMVQAQRPSAVPVGP